MSAIVAKAINDSIGTENFEGFNTILDKQLDRLISSVDDFVENLPPRVEAAIKAASNTILTPSAGDLLYDVLLESKAGKNENTKAGQVGRNFVFKCNGAVLLSCDVEYDSYYGGRLYYLRNDEKVVLYDYNNGIIPNSNTIIPIVENDVLSFHVEIGSAGATGNRVQINRLSLFAKVIPNASIIIS